MSPSASYKPIDLSILSPYFKANLQIELIQNKLDDIYERKDALYRIIQNSETGIANLDIQLELDELTIQETTLLAKAEELKLSIEADKSISSQENLKQYNKDSKNDNLIGSVGQIKQDIQSDYEFDNIVDDPMHELDELQSIRNEIENIENPDVESDVEKQNDR